MPTSLPLSLFCTWALLFCFVLAHEYHLRGIKAFKYESSSQFIKSVEMSSLLGFYCMTGVLIYYLFSVSWYWVIVLGVFGTLAGGLLMGVISGILGEENLSKRAFIGWPLCAIWAISIIHGIK